MTETGRSASIVVVNKDDERVADTLQALTALDDASLKEIVVVDASQGRLDGIRRRFPSVQWVDYTHPEGKARTIAEQRNEGIRSTSGDIVVFLDASCVPSEGWLSSLVAPIECGREQIVVGAIVSSGGGSIHDATVTGDQGKARYLAECANMNIAFRRDLFDRVGYFDESLGFAEDVDFAWRANDAGCRIFFEPRAAISHDWGNAREDLPRAFRYGVARVRLHRKHPSRWRNLYRSELYISVYAVYLLTLPLAIVFPAYLLLLLYPLAKNRRNRPFALLAYQMTYALGALSEVMHIPVTKGQRASHFP